MKAKGKKKPPKLEVPPAPSGEEKPTLLQKGEVLKEHDMHVPAKVDNKGDAVVFGNIAVPADPLKRVPISDSISMSQHSLGDFSGNFSGEFSGGGPVPEEHTGPSEKSKAVHSSSHDDPNTLSYDPTDPTCSGVHISVRKMQRAIQSHQQVSPLVEPSACLPNPQFCCPLMRFGSVTSDQIADHPHFPEEPSAASTDFSGGRADSAPALSPVDIQSPPNGGGGVPLPVASKRRDDAEQKNSSLLLVDLDASPADPAAAAQKQGRARGDGGGVPGVASPLTPVAQQVAAAGSCTAAGGVAAVPCCAPPAPPAPPTPESVQQQQQQQHQAAPAPAPTPVPVPSPDREQRPRSHRTSSAAAQAVERDPAASTAATSAHREKAERRRSRGDGEKSGEPTQHIHFKDLTLKERIGNGAYGVVTRCVHKDGTGYALKTVTVSDDAKRMLRSELERLKQRRAEFAVHTYEAYYSKSAKTVHFLMEYMANGSVGRCFMELRARKRNMHRSDIALIADRVLLALHQLRKHHIIHKDIKPDNILIGLGSQVKIGDFGICAFANQNSEAISVGTGSYSRWMAPERISSDSFSYNSDVYSLGFVVAYLALGRFPLSIQSCRDIIFMVDKGDNLDLSSLQGPENEHLIDFIHKSTRHSKHERPDAGELLEHPFITRRSVPPKCFDKYTLSFLRHMQPLVPEDGENRAYNRYTDNPPPSAQPAGEAR